MKLKDRVAIVGMGCTAFGERFDTGLDDLLIDASNQAFAAAGVDHFICRFGSLDQFGQVERFARDVLPALREHVRVEVR